MFGDVLEAFLEMPDAALDDRIRTIELERRRLDAELAAAIAVADHRRLQAVDGHRSISAYLRATLNCSTSEANRLRGAAKAVDNIDGLGDAWLNGTIGSSQAARFAVLHGNQRVRDRVSEFAPILLNHAVELSYSDFAKCLDRFVALADADGVHNERDYAIEHRDTQVRDVGGVLDINGHGGDGNITSELIAIHRRFTEAEYQADLAARRAEFGDAADQHPLPRTVPQRRFDAMVEIFRRAATAEKLGGAADPLVNIVIDATTWAALLAESGLAPTTSLDGQTIDPFTGLARPDELLGDLVASANELRTRRCETTNGVMLHPHDVLRAALAGHVRRVVVDSAGVTIDMGRRRRLFEGPARDAARLLISSCEHPGCELPTEMCDVDHAEEWANGGCTDQTNSRIRCSSHNIDKTKHQWRSKQATNGHNYTIRTDGTIMLPAGAKPPTFPTNNEDGDDDSDSEAIAELIRQRARALRSA